MVKILLAVCEFSWLTKTYADFFSDCISKDMRFQPVHYCPNFNAKIWLLCKCQPMMYYWWASIFTITSSTPTDIAFHTILHRICSKQLDQISQELHFNGLVSLNMCIRTSGSILWHNSHILYSNFHWDLLLVSFQGIPNEFAQYVAYARALKFDEDPNYNFLRSLFDYRLSVLNMEEPYRPCRLDWLVKIPEKFKDIIEPPDA